MTNGERAGGLIDRIRAGDREAAGELIERYGEEVKAAVRAVLTRGNRLGTRLDPSDVLQSAVRAILSGNAGSAAVEDDRAYLLGAALNRLRDHGRKFEALKRNPAWPGAAVVREGGTEGVEDPSPSPLRALVGREQLDALRNALSPAERWLADARAEGLTWSEIAADAGKAPDAVRKQFARALARVLESLDGADDDDRATGPTR
ncbi:MAG: sigma-70 family RNA polymerase sigma factor [Gemmataceae bacterium]|nr:sigma-70 family RNA polymerase sigma factor [Gemmataceae bacterium]